MRVRKLVLAAVLAIGASMLPAPAANATQSGSCNGHGTLITAAGVRVDAVVTTSYYFSVTGVCMLGLFPNYTFSMRTFTGTGVLTGRCAAWDGMGTIQGHDHSHELVGTAWAIGPFGTAFSRGRARRCGGAELRHGRDTVADRRRRDPAVAAQR